jgi:hypothetical protein
MACDGSPDLTGRGLSACLVWPGTAPRMTARRMQEKAGNPGKGAAAMFFQEPRNA